MIINLLIITTLSVSLHDIVDYDEKDEDKEESLMRKITWNLYFYHLGRSFT